MGRADGASLRTRFRLTARNSIGGRGLRRALTSQDAALGRRLGLQRLDGKAVYLSFADGDAFDRNRGYRSDDGVLCRFAAR
jgi:hypothetical protein